MLILTAYHLNMYLSTKMHPNEERNTDLYNFHKKCQSTVLQSFQFSKSADNDHSIDACIALLAVRNTKCVVVCVKTFTNCWNSASTSVQ